MTDPWSHSGYNVLSKLIKESGTFLLAVIWVFTLAPEAIDFTWSTRQMCIIPFVFVEHFRGYSHIF